MRVLKQIGRVLLIIIAVLVLVISLGGIAGSWYANSVLSDVTNRVFVVVNSGVTLAETGVQRADELVGDGRAEVQNASETVTAVGQNLQENSPVLTALNDRLETRLGPTVELISTTLQPVVNALNTVDQVLGVLNAIPFIQEDAPKLAKLTAAVDGLTQLSADVQQFRTTLRETVVNEKNELTGEAVTVLTDTATRIDNRLAGLETAIQELQTEIDALQVRSAALNSRLLLIFDLAALLMTLLLIWIMYSQIVVIRDQWRGLRSGSASSEAAALTPASPAPAIVESPVAPAVAVETLPTSEPVVVSETAAEVGSAVEDGGDMPNA